MILFKNITKLDLKERKMKKKGKKKYNKIKKKIHGEIKLV